MQNHVMFIHNGEIVVDDVSDLNLDEIPEVVAIEVDSETDDESFIQYLNEQQNLFNSSSKIEMNVNDASMTSTNDC